MKLVEKPSIQMFISYAHADDPDGSEIGTFKGQIKRAVSGITGRPVDVFVDRESIALGSPWREAIQSAVRGSYFFLPVYTGNYISSSNCREEFLEFLASAEELGATRLVIPINWFGDLSLAPPGEDDISDYVREHQAVYFDEARITGPSSEAYRRSVARIAERVIQALPEVDNALVLAEEGRRVGVPDPDPAKAAGGEIRLISEDDPDDLDQEGLLELAEGLSGDITEIGELAEEMTGSITRLGDIEPPPSGVSTQAANAYMIKAGNSMKEPSLEMEERGQRLLGVARSADSRLRKMVLLCQNTEMPSLSDSIYDGLAEGVAALASTESVSEQMGELLDQMKVPEALSASIRRALRPARVGIVALQDALGLMREWPSVVRALAPA